MLSNLLQFHDMLGLHCRWAVISVHINRKTSLPIGLVSNYGFDRIPTSLMDQDELVVLLDCTSFAFPKCFVLRRQYFQIP